MNAFLKKVVLIHGLGRKRVTMASLENKFRQYGYDTINFGHSGNINDITTIANNLYNIVLMNTNKETKINFVTHSLGGIIVRRMMYLHGQDRIGSLVMIAPPNNGSAMARFITDLGNFWGPAMRELADKNHLEKTCLIPTRDTLIIAGTDCSNYLNPATWIGSGLVLDRPNDGTITVEEAKLPNIKLVKVNSCHTSIMSDDETISYSVNFIDQNLK